MPRTEALQLPEPPAATWEGVGVSRKDPQPPPADQAPGPLGTLLPTQGPCRHPQAMEEGQNPSKP